MSKLGGRLVPLGDGEAVEFERRWRESWGELSLRDYYRLEMYRRRSVEVANTPCGVEVRLKRPFPLSLLEGLFRA